MDTETPFGDPGKTVAIGSISEESIKTLVHAFYARAMADDLLGPIFSREVPADMWPYHLDKMCAFWSSTLLKSHRYHGRPLPPHLGLAELGDAHFTRWLSLFKETARAVLDPVDASATVALAERIAHSFRLARAFHEGRDSTALTMLRA